MATSEIAPSLRSPRGMSPPDSERCRRRAEVRDRYYAADRNQDSSQDQPAGRL